MEKSHFFHVHVLLRLKKIQEKKKILKKKAEEAKKAKGITNGKTWWVDLFIAVWSSKKAQDMLTCFRQSFSSEAILLYWKLNVDSSSMLLSFKFSTDCCRKRLLLVNKLNKIRLHYTIYKSFVTTPSLHVESEQATVFRSEKVEINRLPPSTEKMDPGNIWSALPNDFSKYGYKFLASERMALRERHCTVESWSRFLQSDLRFTQNLFYFLNLLFTDQTANLLEDAEDEDLLFN